MCGQTVCEVHFLLDRSRLQSLLVAVGTSSNVDVAVLRPACAICGGMTHAASRGDWSSAE